MHHKGCASSLNVTRGNLKMESTKLWLKTVPTLQFGRSEYYGWRQTRSADRKYENVHLNDITQKTWVHKRFVIRAWVVFSAITEKRFLFFLFYAFSHKPLIKQTPIFQLKACLRFNSHAVVLPLGCTALRTHLLVNISQVSWLHLPLVCRLSGKMFFLRQLRECCFM